MSDDPFSADYNPKKVKSVTYKPDSNTSDDPFSADYSPKKKESLTQKADKVVIPTIEKSKPILKRIGEIINPSIEKAENQMESQGFKIGDSKVKRGVFGVGTKALEVASAPGYGVANTFYQALVNKDLNAAKSFWKGLTLQERKSIGDILVNKFGVPETTTGKLIQGGIGLLSDIVTDPLSWLGVGVTSKVGRKGEQLLKSGSAVQKRKLAERASQIIKGVEPTETTAKTVLTAKIPFTGKETVIPGSKYIADPIARGALNLGLLAKQGLLAPLFDTLGTSFSRDYRPSTVDPVTWEKFIRGVEKAESYENLIKENAKEAAVEVKRSFKEEGISEQKLNDILRRIEKMSYEMPESKGEAIARTEASKMSRIYKEIGPTGKSTIQGYLPHIKNDVSDKKQIGMGSKLFTTKTPSDIARNYMRMNIDGLDYTVNISNGKVFKDGKVVKRLTSEEIKKANIAASEGVLKQGTIQEINKDVGLKLFSTDLPKLLYIQGQRVGKAAGSDKLFREARKFGESDEIIARKKGLVPVQAPELEGKWFDPEVAQRIDERYKDTIQLTEDPIVGKRLIDVSSKLFEKINQEWKTLATIVNIPFHTTNMISSMWQNMNRGLEPLSASYLDGAKIARSIATKKTVTPELQKYIQEMKENNLIKTGFFTSDIEKSIDSELMSYFDLMKRNKNIPINTLEVIKKAGGQAGQTIESFVRSSLFVDLRKKGYNATDAARIVRDTHFDYSDLTKGEKEIRKFIPFYTWNKKNLALQFNNLLQRPDKATRIIKLKNNVEAMVGPDDYETIQDEAFLKQFPIFIGEKDGKRRYVMLNRFVPNLATNQAGEPLNWVARNFSPVITTMASLIYNIDIPGSVAFGKARRVKDPGDIGEFMGVTIPKELEYGIKMIRPLMELERISGTRIDTPQKKDIWMQLLFGKNIKEFNEQDLIRWFDIRSEQEAVNLSIKLKNLRRQLATYPEKEKVIMKKYNKILDLMIKSKTEQMNKKMQAFENL